MALLLEYDGARFAGSQLQPGQRTVQGELEQSIADLFGEPVRTAFAGRTDAGVHASGQVAAFSAEHRYSPVAVRGALNARLPEDVAVRAVREVDVSFDPRRHASERAYRYTILRGFERSPLWRGRAWCVRSLPHVTAMREAGAALVGRQDFRAFAGKLERPGASSVRTLRAVEVRECGDFVHVEMVGDAFLPHQVRITAGALVRVGQGALSAKAFAGLLNGRETGSAGPAAPPEGLCLIRVTYRGLRFDADEETNTADV
jgi:tRNA pseudouridine38-40 synthase